MENYRFPHINTTICKHYSDTPNIAYGINMTIIVSESNHNDRSERDN
ncbi:hypothetical protein J3E06_001223 [Methanococcus voltae]|uniref:Uncharacterized protein n=1 Tax=Methanococcus voltae (strain ATCC BAA-1334 / A3) TaxID=456320 RepID=D7DS94_METV3|nr:hypothetical protein [Methanococcus voltae]